MPNILSRITSYFKKPLQTGEIPSSFPLFEIGYFQFENLIKNRIPFTLINLDVNLENFFREKFYQSYMESQMHKCNPEEIMNRFAELNLPKDQALVLLCEDGNKSLKIFKDLSALGYSNVYYVPQGFKQLLSERTS